MHGDRQCDDGAQVYAGETFTLSRSSILKPKCASRSLQSALVEAGSPSLPYRKKRVGTRWELSVLLMSVGCQGPWPRMR